MNWIDLVLIGLLVLGTIKGLIDGALKQFVSIIALVAAIYFSGEVALWLRDYISALNFFPAKGVLIASNIAGFLLIIVVILLIGELINKVFDATPLGLFNHIIGGLIGAISTAFIVSLIINLVEPMASGSALLGRQTRIESVIYYPLKEVVPAIMPNSWFE